MATNTEATVLRKRLRPRQIADALGVCIDKVLGWIHAGQLRAINVARDGSKIPQYVVDPDDLAAFERTKEACPRPADKPQPGRRTSKDANGTKYCPEF